MPPAAMEALIGRMARQLRRFDQRGDHRAAFLRVYTHMTRRVLLRMQGGFFLDPPWVARVAQRFAGYYFEALAAYDEGRRPPPAWALAFEAAAAKRTFLLQDVALGVNAHINNDLPQVLHQILLAEGDWPLEERMTRRRFDHDQINRILHEIVPAVEGEVARHYGRLVGALGWAMGTLDESLAAFGLKQCRDNTWRNAMFLLACRSDTEQAAVRDWIEQDAHTVGSLIIRYGAPAWARPAAGPARRLRLC